VFRSLPVVERTFRDGELPDGCGAYAVDCLTLGWEDRLKVRGRRRSDGGVEFGIALPRGTVLRDGDRLVVDVHRLVVTVVERSELVLVITPRSAREWATYAYHIGNGHNPLMVTDQALVCPDMPGVESLLQYHEIPYERGLRPFTPVAGVSPHT
jgi:urease accessory protein